MEEYLSVYVEGLCDLAYVLGQFNRCYAIAVLTVGDVRALGLDVVVDDPPHARIVGLPSRFVETEIARALRLANDLAALSTIVWP